MSDPTSRHRLRRQGLPFALACALAAGLGGCSTLRMPDFTQFGWSRTSCSASDAWPTKVKGSLQRADTSEWRQYAGEEPSEPAASERVTEDWSERLEVTQEPDVPEPEVPETPVAKDIPEPTAKDVAEPAPTTVPEPPEQSVAEPAPTTVPEAAPKDLGEPAPTTVPEAAPKDLAQPAPPAVPESAPKDLAEPAPKEDAAPLAETAPPAAPPQAPAAELPAAEPDKDVIARLPEASFPARTAPSEEVVRMCGASDTACQDELTTLLADPSHAWMNAQPTPREERTGVRILAYRVLAPALTCEDLRRGLLETLSDTGEDASAPPEATESGKSQAWVQLLRRAVELELRSEIDKRC